jgi:hypothetical protein
MKFKYILKIKLIFFRFQINDNRSPQKTQNIVSIYAKKFLNDLVDRYFSSHLQLRKKSILPFFEKHAQLMDMSH